MTVMPHVTDGTPMTAAFDAMARLVLASTHPDDRTGPTLVFVATILVVALMLGAVIRRAVSARDDSAAAGGTTDDEPAPPEPTPAEDPDGGESPRTQPTSTGVDDV